MIKKALKRGHRVVFAGSRMASKQALEDTGVIDKLDEVLHHLHGVKNSETIKTGPYEALTRLFTGQKIYVDTRDISLAPHIMLDGHWEPEITTLFRQQIEPDSIIFDIGANFGYFGLVAGTNIDPKRGQVHFFEANPQLTPYIFKSISINGLLPCTQVVNKAVSDRPGDIELTILEDFWGSSGIGLSEASLTYAGHKIGIKDKVKVAATTIDDYIKHAKLKAVDLIKMDIEGHEETAYKGMRKTIKNSPKVKMFIEFTEHAYTDAKKFFDNMLEDFGHMYAVSNEGGGKLIPVKSYASLKKMMDDNWIMLVASKQPVAA